MPEVTYYWDTYYSSAWADPDNMIDGILTNYATTASDGTLANLSSTNCPGTDLGTITKVEMRVYGYGDGNDQIILWGTPITMLASPGWSSWIDTALDGDWTWAKVADLYAETGWVCYVEFNAVAKGNTMYCAKVEIRVTYWAPPVADIDVGAMPVDRASGLTAGRTHIDKNNPANASGTLHSVKVYAVNNITGLRVGTFYTTNGNTLKCRDSVVIGAVEAGAERTFTELSIAVETGDYIGCYFTGGDIEADLTGFAGRWYIVGEYIDPNDETTYTFYEGDAISLYGYGDIVAVPENTVYLVKATGQRTQLSAGAVPIKIDPATGRRGTDPSFPKFLVREDDGTLRAKSA